MGRNLKAEQAAWPNPWRKLKRLPEDTSTLGKEVTYARADLRALVGHVERWWPTYNDIHTSSHDDGDPDFYGRHTWDSFAREIAEGSPKKAARLEKLERAALAAVPSLRGGAPRTVLGVAGGSVSIGRHIAGSPACMRRRIKVRQAKGKSVRVAVNVAASCGVQGKSMERYALAAMAIVRAIESRGVQVELDAVSGSKGGGEHGAVTCISIKRAGSYLDRNKFAALCAESFHRRLGFALKERHPDWGKHWGVGYGYPRSLHGPEWQDALGYDLMIPALQYWGPRDMALRAPGDPDYKDFGAGQWDVKDEELIEALPVAIKTVLNQLGM